MDDLISRKALLEALAVKYLSFDDKDPEQLGYLGARVIARNQLAVDAVPVVRCRECRHRQNTKECLMCFTEVVDVEDGKLYQFRDLTKDDGFCDRGERRDNDAQAD